MSLDRFHEQAAAVAERIRSQPRGTRWLLHCDSDADGLSSAAVMSLALARIGHRFHIQASREKTQQAYDELAATHCDAIMVLDKGSNHLAAIGAAAGDRLAVVVDHHNITDESDVALLNPRACGLDGSHDACSSTTSVALAMALVGEPALAWAGIGIVGAIGDWQHMGGWGGWNKALIDRARDAGHLFEKRQPAYVGPDLVEALVRRPEPHLPGITGDRDGAHQFLDKLGLADFGDVEALDKDQQTSLVSGLTAHGLAHGVAPGQLRRITSGNLSHPYLGGLRYAFRTVDACGREGRPDVGIAFLLGDPDEAAEARSLYDGYRATIGDGLRMLDTEGPEWRTNFGHLSFTHPEYTGMVAGLGLTVVLEDKRRPLVVSAPRPDGLLQVSTRGLEPQVKAGLDLGDACRQAGNQVGREGGGHPIAAGIVVAPDELDAFLAALDQRLSEQGFYEAP